MIASLAAYVSDAYLPSCDSCIVATPDVRIGQKVDVPRGLWVNCDPSSGKNAVVVGPTVTAKNGSRALIPVNRLRG